MWLPILILRKEVGTPLKIFLIRLRKGVLEVAALNEYLTSSLDKIEAKFPNSGILIAGDFNKFDFKASAKCYQLEPIIKIPTQGKNTLVSLTTYLSRSCPTFVRNLKPRVRPSKRTTKDLVAWLVLVVICWRSYGTLHWVRMSHAMISWLQLEIINYGLDAIMPVRSVKVRQPNRPWLNADLKQLIQKRQQAFSSSNTFLFKLLRNKVNRERKRCWAIYYNNKVRDLKNTRPRNWWRKVTLWKWR